MPLLSVSQISIREGRNFALHPLSFQQEQGQKIAIAGETGSGKSTLLQIIAGLVQPDSGIVQFAGQKVAGPAETLVPGHPGIAYLSQQFELPGFLRVEQVLSYANSWPAAEAAALYRLCHIDRLLTRKTDQLSGGERQRIALAKLLLGAPKLLLLDEPFSNLDAAHKSLLKDVIRDIGEKLGITVQLISHDPQDTLSWADEILVMQAGALIQHGTPVTIYRQPRNAYVAALFGEYNLLPAHLTRALTGLTAWPAAKTQSLVRPEQVQILTHTGEGLPGTVQEITFYGAYYLLGVAVGEATIKVKTHLNQWTTGQPVRLSVLPANIWYL